MTKIKHAFGLILALWSSSFLGGVTANEEACALIGPKRQNFGGLELVRACSIIDLQVLVDLGIFPDTGISCADLLADLGLPAFVPQEPLLNLVANDMLYFNWEIKDVQGLQQVLQDELDVPDGFNIAKIKIIEQGPSKHYLSLNFYSSVINNVLTYRSEWSVYVTTNDDPKPRYMVIQVYSSQDTSDPTALPPEFTLPAVNVGYTIGQDAAMQVLASNPDFEAIFSLAETQNQQKTVFADCEWAKANDALYYTNGIADTALYNGGLFDVPLLYIIPASVDIFNNSTWSAFINEKPDNIIKFQQPLEFAFTPYFNLQDPNFDPAYQAALQAYKSIAFGAASYGNALFVLQGIQEPLVRLDIKTSNVPSVFINYEIRNVTGLANEIALPPGFKLTTSKITKQGPERFLLSLNIYESVDILTGALVNRAEWSVYVQDTNDPDGEMTYLMIIDVESNSASLNPVDGQTPPNVGFVYSRSGDTIAADIPGKYSIQFDMPESDANGPPVALEKEWILSNDRIYWRNGVYDELFYNGLFLDADVAQVDLNTVTVADETPWSEFVDAMPLQVLVIRNDLQYVVHPWYNVEELCAGIPI